VTGRFDRQTGQSQQHPSPKRVYLMAGGSPVPRATNFTKSSAGPIDLTILRWISARAGAPGDRKVPRKVPVTPFRLCDRTGARPNELGTPLDNIPCYAQGVGPGTRPLLIAWHDCRNSIRSYTIRRECRGRDPIKERNNSFLLFRFCERSTTRAAPDCAPSAPNSVGSG
jgi:hypothetical protein